MVTGYEIRGGTECYGFLALKVDKTSKGKTVTLTEVRASDTL